MIAKNRTPCLRGARCKFTGPRTNTQRAIITRAAAVFGGLNVHSSVGNNAMCARLNRRRATQKLPTEGVMIDAFKVARWACVALIVIVILAFALTTIRDYEAYIAPSSADADDLREEQAAAVVKDAATIEELHEELSAIRAYREKLANIIDKIGKLAPAIIGSLALLLAMPAPEALAGELPTPAFRVSVDGRVCFSGLDAARLLHAERFASVQRLELRTLRADRVAAGEEIRVLEKMHNHTRAQLVQAYDRIDRWQDVEKKLRKENARLASKLASTSKRTNILLAVSITVVSGAVIGIVAVRK